MVGNPEPKTDGDGGRELSLANEIRILDSDVAIVFVIGFDETCKSNKPDPANGGKEPLNAELLSEELTRGDGGSSCKLLNDLFILL